MTVLQTASKTCRYSVLIVVGVRASVGTGVGDGLALVATAVGVALVSRVRVVGGALRAAQAQRLEATRLMKVIVENNFIIFMA